jgi:hypothetical protein
LALDEPIIGRRPEQDLSYSDCQYVVASVVGYSQHGMAFVFSLSTTVTSKRLRAAKTPASMCGACAKQSPLSHCSRHWDRTSVEPPPIAPCRLAVSLSRLTQLLTRTKSDHTSAERTRLRGAVVRSVHSMGSRAQKSTHPAGGYVISEGRTCAGRSDPAWVCNCGST